MPEIKPPIEFTRRVENTKLGKTLTKIPAKSPVYASLFDDTGTANFFDSVQPN